MMDGAPEDWPDPTAYWIWDQPDAIDQPALVLHSTSTRCVWCGAYALRDERSGVIAWAVTAEILAFSCDHETIVGLS